MLALYKDQDLVVIKYYIAKNIDKPQVN